MWNSLYETEMFLQIIRVVVFIFDDPAPFSGNQVCSCSYPFYNFDCAAFSDPN
jgi:hypothetical protein